MKRLVVIALALFFFVGNYHICNYFYPLDTIEHIENWWILKMDIYALIVLLCIMAANMEKSSKEKIIKLEKFVASVGIGLAVSNIIDRHVYDLESYVMSDTFTVVIVLFIGYIEYNKFFRIVNPFKDE